MPHVLSARSRVRRTNIVTCDVCGEEVENSEELAKHKERMHAVGGDKPEQESQESPELPEEPEVPEPAQRPGGM
jgi:hypothetical protein